MSFKMSAGSLLFCLAILSGCGASKEMLPAHPDSALPDFPTKEKPVEEAGTMTVKREELQISHINEEVKTNSFLVASGADKFARLQKSFRLPIHYNGWLTLTDVYQSFDRCTGNVAEPEFQLVDDLGGNIKVVVGEKIPMRIEKLYVLKVLFDNATACSGINIQFGVVYGE